MPIWHSTMEKTDFSIRLGQNLRHLRAMRGYTIERMAEAVGESPDNVKHYEYGDRSFPASKIYSYAAALNCDPQTILLGLDPRRSDPPKPLAREINRLTEEEHQIMLYLSTYFEGDLHALITSLGIYARLLPSRRREVIMTVTAEMSKALAAGELRLEDLPTGLPHLEEQLGKLYSL